MNDKGGAEHRVNLIKRGKGTFQNNLLKTVLVRKAENYHLQCDRFLTNHLPPILQTETILISIKPKGDLGAISVKRNFYIGRLSG